jgi:hypothetical protein
MLSEQEKKQILELKAQGYTAEQVKGYLAGKRLGRNSTISNEQLSEEVKKNETKPSINQFTDAIGFGGAVDVFGSQLARTGFGPQTAKQGKEFIEKPTAKQTVGAVGQVGVTAAGTLLTGGTSLLGQVAVGTGLGYLYDVSSKVAEGQTGKEAVTPGAATAAGLLIPPALRGLGKAAGTLLRPLSRPSAKAVVPQNVVETSTDTVQQAITPLMRTAKEFAINRPSRLLHRVEDKITENKKITELYNQGTPAVREAVDSGLDQRIINTITESDEATKAGYREIIDLAEGGGNKLGVSQRPEIVAGNAAAEQYKLINNQRQEVGQKIGEAIDQLSVNSKFDATPLYAEVSDTLARSGIRNNRGVLDFAGTNYTDKQRVAIQKLYDLLVETGGEITPRQLYNKDRLLSQLQREARFDGVSNIFVKNAEGKEVDLFSALRKTFSDELEGIAPDIKPLNSEYQQLRALQDDIENSIFKSGNFQGTRDVDPAEFAQTNLRRIFSDAQSAADYRIIYDNLDAYSRSLGYEGARADDLAAFAIKMRDIYPDSVPPTSATNIFGGVKNMIGEALNIGKANVTDQQKALKALLGEPPSFNQGAKP